MVDKKPLIQIVNEEELKGIVGVLISRDGSMHFIKDAYGAHIQTPDKFYLGIGACYLRMFLEVPEKKKHDGSVSQKD